MDKIVLSEEQMIHIKEEWSKDNQHHGDGCLCGSYVCNIKDIGFIVVDTSCRRSSNCPSGMDWFVHEEVSIYNKNVLNEFGDRYCVEDLEEQDIRIIAMVNKKQSLELKEVVRRAIIRDYSFNGHIDEYGNDIREKVGKVINFGLNTDDSEVVMVRDIGGWYLTLTSPAGYKKVKIRNYVAKEIAEEFKQSLIE